MRSILLLILLAAVACESGPPSADAPTDSEGAAIVDTPATHPAPGADPAFAGWLDRVDESVYTRWGACPFECCVYRDWLAEGPVIVRAQPDSAAAIVATIPAGQRFEADSGFVRITSAQIVVVTAPVEAYRQDPGAAGGGSPDTLLAGDTLLVLEHVGEGHWMLTRGADFVSAEQFWAEPDGFVPYGGARATTYGSHAAEWWTHVTTADGAVGWIDAYGSELGNVDACGA